MAISTATNFVLKLNLKTNEVFEVRQSKSPAAI